MSFPDLNGYLRKQSRQGRWQQRYFEASTHYLTYYKNQNKEKLLACIDLWRTEEIAMDANDPDKLQFNIRIGEQSYILKAETTEKAEQWISGLLLRQHRPEGTPSEGFSTRSEQLDMDSDISSDFGQRVYAQKRSEQQLKAASEGGSSGGRSSCSSLSGPRGSAGQPSYTDSSENPIVPNAIVIAQSYPYPSKFHDFDQNSNSAQSDGYTHAPCCVPACNFM